ncbi:MAG: class I SAM-dependent DNA methyltransferase [Kiritimatiellae bacterium]|nr:class I SAM-dependent DNA methyltransferase [Kiritimatiellia bacterium]
MTVAEFIAKWRHVDLKERSAAQEHFLDLCHLLGHPTPAEADPTGERFCFEKGIAKHGGGDGFADVWKKGFFGWEYKGKHKDLNAAYNQLLLYRDALASPPLLVLCDLDRIIVHTNFTNTVSARHEIALEQLGEPRNIEILRAVFFDPEKLRPGQTSEAVTRMAAEQIAGIAESMRGRDLDAAAVAHFLDRVVFCLFAEDIGLLPSQLFTRIAESAGSEPATFRGLLNGLFANMSTGGHFGVDRIRHFNGSLFDSTEVPDLTADEVKRIVAAVRLDWSAVDPSIFGTLFERGLDPAKRSQLGAHFTGKEDIRTLVDAVVMTPLRREWDETRQTVTNLLTTGKKSVPPGGVSATLTPAQAKKADMEASSLIHAFLTRLQNVKVLDPACGSGNFLYVSLQALKDLEKEAIVFSMDNGLGSFIPLVGPWQLYGIEINPYAHDLAQMTVWIGWLQWIRLNGFGSPNEPILRAIPGNFQCRDAIIDLTDPVSPKEPEWPRVDFIVGNPPFLGGNRIRQELGDAYVENIFALYKDRVPAFADLCCYWFEKARAHIEAGGCKRAGLLATQGIRGGANREVLKRIKRSGDLFWAVSDRDWIQDGATVHVSMAAFDNGEEETRTLDGNAVVTINPDLTSCADVTAAVVLAENKGISFQGPSPKAPFDIDADTAAAMLADTGNPNGRPNSDVVRPVVSAVDIGQSPRGKWTIDFALMTMDEAAQYEKPFEHVKINVLPAREQRRDDYRGMWWQYARPRPEMRAALEGKRRYIATPRVSKHRLFLWLDANVLANDGTIVFARDDDAFFGVLHSRIHEVWARAQGTQLREEESGCRYTPTTSFETFPLPRGTSDLRPLTSGLCLPAIAAAARELVEKRDLWLKPEGASPAELKKRTLTNLYNARPTWLDLAHRKLDANVAAAYGWPADLADEQILEHLLALNLERAKA